MGQVFPEQFGLILDYLVNLKYCSNFSKSNCSSKLYTNTLRYDFVLFGTFFLVIN